LEEQLGEPLFERKPREVVLTDLGDVLLERAKEILKLVDDTFCELSEPPPIPSNEANLTP
jgi:LysR family transcriptional regulator, hydrogen peroxide-inducible genes activator